ncbi:MAG: Asp-tRNA(Asn)/Glu-tRNA(Gln) amidotransferase GatCAB subunit B, partial [Planctomycetota bacterium]
ELSATLPELPLARRNRFVAELGLSDYDAGVLTEDKAVADYFERCITQYDSPKAVCNWVTNHILRELKERQLEIKDFPVGPEMLVELIKLVETGAVSMPVARGVFVEMVNTKKKAPQLVQERGLLQISDSAELEGIIQAILTENPNALTDYKKGKKTAFTFLVGQIMRKTKGKANPQMVNELLKQKLEAS